jgi:hypothetical protein
MDEISFKVADVDYKVVQPNLEQLQEAQTVYNRAFNKALRTGSPLQVKVKDILTEQGLWDDTKQNDFDKIQKEILEKEFTLHKGGILKTEARKVAIELKRLRVRAQELFVPISNFNQHTCEGQAQNAKFDYMVSVCVVYSDGRPYFSSLEDYLNKSNDAVAILGSNKFAELHYRLMDSDLGADLPENQFLKEHGFVDDKYRLIDKKGRLVTEDGRLINEDGNLVDEDGNLVDILGHKLDKDGNFVVERKPFLDEEADSEQDSAKT